MGALTRFARRRHLPNDSGSELIELAIVLPILLFVIAAIVDFGFLFQRYEVVTNAAREGARVAILPNYTVADVQARVQSYLVASGLTGAPAASVNQSLTQTLPGGQIVGLASVTVTYTHNFLYLSPIAALVGAGSHGAITLTAVSTMRSESAASGS
jgi:Flp pilus assembly protein TadG